MGGSQLTTHKPLYPSGATCTLSVALCNRHVRDTCPFHLSFSSSLCTYVPFNKILILMVHPNLLYTLLLYRCTTQHKIMPQSYMGFFFLFFFWAYLAWFGSPGHHSPSLPPLGNCPSLLSSSVNIYYAPVKSKLWTYWESYWRRLSCRYLLSWKRLFRLGFMLNGPAGTPLYPAHGQLLLSRLPSGFPKIPLWSNSILQQNATLKVSYLFWSLNPQSSNSFDIFLSCSRPYRSN